MKRFYKVFVWLNIIIWLLTAMFFALQFFMDIFKYFAIVGGTLGFVTLCVYEIYKYKDLQEKIKQGYDLYLLDYYREGFITKEQFLAKAPELYPEYRKLFRKEKWSRILVFLLFFGLALSLVTYLIKIIF